MIRPYFVWLFLSLFPGLCSGWTTCNVPRCQWAPWLHCGLDSMSIMVKHILKTWQYMAVCQYSQWLFSCLGLEQWTPWISRTFLVFHWWLGIAYQSLSLWVNVSFWPVDRILLVLGLLFVSFVVSGSSHRLFWVLFSLPILLTDMPWVDLIIFSRVVACAFFRLASLTSPLSVRAFWLQWFFFSFGYGVFGSFFCSLFLIDFSAWFLIILADSRHLLYQGKLPSPTW